ncbi:hypothetical protein ACFV0L_28605 [Streptosporangium canum]|uniref:hypothetical protein n=1 Tax=Streptosporangium canum TaxID=324952 RepID=UPI00367F97A0
MWFVPPAAGLPSKTIMELPPCVETGDVPSELLNRIRERSPFWVDVIVKGATRPSSGLPGIVVTNPFPDEALDYATCTVDGIGDNIPGPVVP